MNDMTYGKCEKCGHDLIAGVNWYTMNPKHVCTDCSGSPKYYQPVITRTVTTYDEMCAAEEAILEMQDMWDC